MRFDSKSTARRMALLVFALLGVAVCLLVTASKAAESKDDRYAQLLQLVDSGTNVISFTSVNTYTKFVHNTGRNYDIFVFLVSVPGRR
jgi:hypothetical protein